MRGNFFQQKSLVISFDTAFVAWTDSLVADLHLPRLLANWVSAALPLASNWIPQLFLLNSQTSEESQCKPQQKQKERKDRGGRRRALV